MGLHHGAVIVEVMEPSTVHCNAGLSLVGCHIALLATTVLLWFGLLGVWWLQGQVAEVAVQVAGWSFLP